MKILVVNCGSSSLKYQLFDMDKEQVMTKGLVERIGGEGARIEQKTPGREVYEKTASIPSHKEAVKGMFDALMDSKSGVIADLSEIDAVGHRVLHGGSAVIASTLVDEACIQAVEANSKFGPLHNPPQLSTIRACASLLGKEVAQVAVMDTAFHQTMPPENYVYPIPYQYYEEDGVRRYGFHGTSHRYISKRVAQLLKIPEDQLNIISCHLGNGSSLCAVKNGKSYNTTMGLTALSGLPMGTRSGDIDPGILIYLGKQKGLSIEDLDRILNKESGVLGVSGVSSDFRDLEKAAEGGNERARLALKIFHTSVRRVIGAYAAELGKVDAITFTGGIGEHGAKDRAAICENLEIIGAKLDPAKNEAKGQKEWEISADDSKIKIWVIPTDEELMIARDTKKIIEK